MNPNSRELLFDFVRVAELARVAISENDIILEHLPAPHSPPSRLPEGKIAVYAFFWGEQCLKVGKAGPKSQARYISQHYNAASSKSNLAKSILGHQRELGLNGLNENTITDWIKNNTSRINFLVDTKVGIPVLNLLEVFLQCRLRPRFEGF